MKTPKQTTVKYYTSDLITSIAYIEVPKKIHKKENWTKKEYKNFVYTFLSSLTLEQHQALTDEYNEHNQECAELFGDDPISYSDWIDYVVGSTLDNRQLEQVS